MDHEDHQQPADQAVRSQVSRILASSVFASSERMARFLSFVVEEALRGRAGELKEYLIGLKVFDRKQTYDPRVDPIVRVEARRLRSKLASYYSSDGQGAEVIIELPKGSYAPKISRSAAGSSGTHSEPVSRAASAPAREPLPKTVAVLPFANVSRDPDNEYFSDGLTEELIHALTKVPGLRVVAWSSAARVRGGERDIYGIGQQLGVATVLMGSVRCDGGRIRILAQLVETKTGFYLWSETYDRNVQEMFAIQQEIAASIVTALRAKLGETVQRREYDFNAYNEYLRGRYHWNKRTGEGLRRALVHFENALTIDPAFALGYAGLADTYVLLSDYGVVHPTDSISKARAAATRALEIDGTLGEAEASLGIISCLYDWQWSAGEQHYLRALKLNPGYATGFHWFGLDFCALRGRWPEALSHVRKALELDPLSSIIREGLGYVHLLKREYEMAVQEYRKLLDFDETFYKAHSSLGRALSMLGSYDAAIESFRRARTLCGDVPNILGALGQTYGLAGATDNARQTLGELHGMSRSKHVTSVCFALVHLGLGERECALNWLEKGVARRETSLAACGVHAAFDDLRSEPRFNAILRAVGHADMIRS